MSKVKWVKYYGFAEDDETDVEVREYIGQVPVILLADLAEVVEELRKLRDTCRSAMVLAGLPDEFIDKKTNPADDLLTQLEGQTT